MSGKHDGTMNLSGRTPETQSGSPLHAAKAGDKGEACASPHAEAAASCTVTGGRHDCGEKIPFRPLRGKGAHGLLNKKPGKGKPRPSLRKKPEASLHTGKQYAGIGLQRMKFVLTMGSISGRGTPAARPASMQRSIHAMLRARCLMV